MKLLFDQNLSRQLCRPLHDILPNSAQVRSVGLDRADDTVIWDFARANHYSIVTLDADFADLAVLRGAPPKVVWLRCGNQSTADTADLLRAHADLLNSFLRDDEATCIELY